MSYENVWLNIRSKKHYLIFGLQGNAEGHVVVARWQGVYTTNMFEIILGARHNTEMQLKDETGQIIMTKSLGQVMDPYTYSFFWISWTKDVLYFGVEKSPGLNMLEIA